MIYLKTKNFIILSFLFAIIAYFIANISEVNQFSQFLPSIFIVLMAITLFFTSTNDASGNESSPNHRRDSIKPDNPETHVDVESGTLYVGNLAYKADENDLKAFFENVGHVKSVRLVKDKRSGKKKGFGFVEIKSGEEHYFIDKLNKTEFMQRNIIVRHANEKQH